MDPLSYFDNMRTTMQIDYLSSNRPYLLFKYSFKFLNYLLLGFSVAFLQVKSGFMGGGRKK